MYETLSEQELRKILGDLESIPKDLQNTVTLHSSQIAGLDLRVDGHDAILASHGGRLNSAESAITNLTARVDNHDTDISVLDARTDELEAKAIRVVTTEAEVLAAAATPGKIVVRGLITLTAGLVPTTNDIDWEADGRHSGFLLPHNGTSQQTVMWVKGLRNTFKGLRFTTNHPLTSGRAFADIGLRLPTAAGETCSGLVVDNCRFENLGWGILRDGSSSSAAIDGVNIKDCTFEGIFQGCIYVRWFTHDLHIINCRFQQRTLSQTHDIENNAIYIANRCDGIIVELNRIKRFGRHAIEIWNNTDDPLAADSNFNPLVAFNTIDQPLPYGSFTPIGITILGKGIIRYSHNTVKDCVIAYEVPGDPVNDGHHKVLGNTATNTKNQAFSINGVAQATVKHNTVQRVAIDGFPGITADPIGMQIIHGGRNVKVHDNDFIDAGRFAVWVAGRALLITGITQAADAVFTVSAAIGDTARPNGWYVGKRICLRGIGGMTALNDKYYTITFVSGSTFKLGVDTSAMAAYTSGGQVQEDFAGLSICDNDFYIYDEIDPAWSGPALFARSIYMHDFQQATVQGNTRYVSSALTGYWGSYSAINYGTVYQDYSLGTVSTTSGEVVIAGSNQTISIFPG